MTFQLPLIFSGLLMAAGNSETLGNGLEREDNDNQLRIANLVFKIAPSALRVFFDKQFKPESLQLVLNQNRFKTLQHLKTKKVINQTQWNLLFPSKGKHLYISYVFIYFVGVVFFFFFSDSLRICVWSHC